MTGLFFAILQPEPSPERKPTMPKKQPLGGLAGSPALQHQLVLQILTENFNLRFQTLTGLKALGQPPLEPEKLATTRIPDLGIYVVEPKVYQEWLERNTNSLGKLPMVQDQMVIAIEADHEFDNQKYKPRFEAILDKGVSELFCVDYTDPFDHRSWFKVEKSGRGISRKKNLHTSDILGIDLRNLLTESTAEARQILTGYIGDAFKTHQAHMDKQFKDIRKDMDKRFADVRQDMDKRFEAVDKRFDALEGKIDSIIDLLKTRNIV